MAGGLPTITSHRKNAGEILDSLRLSLPTVAPGQTPGALRFVSLALHILPQKGGRHRRNVSARKLSEPELHSETHFSKAQPRLFAHYRKNSQHTTSLNVLAEPNYYSKCVRTSSTRIFASHYDGNWNARRNHACVSRAGAFPREVLPKERSGFQLRTPASLMPARRLNLLIPPPASTLQVFQFIRRFVLR